MSSVHKGQPWPMITKLMLILIAVLTAVPGLASPAKLNITGTYWGGAEFANQDLSINRFSLRSKLKKRWGRRLQLDLAGELDWSNDKTGLGSTNTYAPLSEPIIETNHLRLELSRATLRYRSKDISVTLGKQTLAWGMLDGLRVADRASPVRRRDFILTEQRPERLGRWGIRSRARVGTTKLDAAVLFDNTADQSPLPGDAFFPSASRSLGGFEPDSIAALGLPPVAERSHGLDQATFALKLGRQVGAFDLQLIGLHGPDTEAIVEASSPADPTTLELRYPLRTLLAINLQRSIGATVVRFEGAVIPDQRVNLAVPGTATRARRVLAGVGIDVKLAGSWFVNAQLGIDTLEPRSKGYSRPRTDVVGTLRVQRSFVQDRLGVKAELIGSPKAGDGYLGTSLSWQFDDRLKGAMGVDWLFGERDELFGQFSRRSRAWLRVTYSP